MAVIIDNLEMKWAILGLLLAVALQLSSAAYQCSILKNKDQKDFDMNDEAIGAIEFPDGQNETNFDALDCTCSDSSGEILGEYTPTTFDYDSAIYDEATGLDWRDVAVFMVRDCASLIVYRLDQGTENDLAFHLDRRALIFKNIGSLFLRQTMAFQKGTGDKEYEGTFSVIHFRNVHFNNYPETAVIFENKMEVLFESITLDSGDQFRVNVVNSENFDNAVFRVEKSKFERADLSDGIQEKEASFILDVSNPMDDDKNFKGTVKLNENTFGILAANSIKIEGAWLFEFQKNTIKLAEEKAKFLRQVMWAEINHNTFEVILGSPMCEMIYKTIKNNTKDLTEQELLDNASEKTYIGFQGNLFANLMEAPFSLDLINQTDFFNFKTNFENSMLLNCQCDFDAGDDRILDKLLDTTKCPFSLDDMSFFDYRSKLCNGVFPSLEDLTMELIEELTPQIQKNVSDLLTQDIWDNVTMMYTEILRQNVTDELEQELIMNITVELTQSLWDMLLENYTVLLWTNLTMELKDQLLANVTRDLTEEITENVTRDKEAEMWLYVSTEYGQMLWDNITTSYAESLRQNITQELWQSMWDNATELLYDAIWQNITTQLTENITAQAVMDLTNEIRENVTREIWEAVFLNVTVGYTSELWENLTSMLTEEMMNAIHNATKQLYDEAKQNATRDLWDEIWQNATMLLTDQIREEVTEDLTEEITMNVTEILSQEIRENLTRDFQDEIWDYAAKVLADDAEFWNNLTSKLTAEITVNVTRDLTPEILENITLEFEMLIKENLTKELTDEFIENITAVLYQEARDKAKEELTEELRQNVTAELTDAITEQVREEMTDDYKEEIMAELIDKVRVDVLSQLRDEFEKNATRDLEEKLKKEAEENLTDEIEKDISKKWKVRLAVAVLVSMVLSGIAVAGIKFMYFSRSAAKAPPSTETTSVQNFTTKDRQNSISQQTLVSAF